MHRLLLENYVKQIKKSDIYNFALINNIDLSEKDIDILYYYLKKNWKELLYGNKNILNDLKQEIDEKKFLKIKSLFEIYYNKYQDLL